MLALAAAPTADTSTAIELMGNCYSQSLHACMHDRNPAAMPGCETILAALAETPEPIINYAERLPLCEEAMLRAEQAAALLPPCYSQSLDDCLNGRPNDLVGCDLINEGYDLDKRTIQNLPLCDEPRPAWGEMLASAAAAFVLGYFVGKLSR